MSNFFTKAPFVEPSATPGAVVASGIVRTRRYFVSHPGAPQTDFALSSIPWGTAVNGFTTTTPTTTDDVSSYQSLLEATQAALGPAQSARDSAKSGYDAAVAAVADAQQAFDAANDSVDAARMVLWKAEINLTTAQGTGDATAVDDAQTRLTTAQQAVNAARVVASDALQTLGSRQQEHAQKLSLWQQKLAGVASAQASIDGTAFILTLVQANQAATEAAGSDPETGYNPHDGYSTQIAGTNSGYGVIVAYCDWARDTGASTATEVKYGISELAGEYQVQATLSNEEFQAARSAGLSMVLTWCEITDSRPITTQEVGDGIGGFLTIYVVDDSAERVLSHVEKSQTFPMTDGVQTLSVNGSTVWVFTSDTFSVAAPDGGTVDTPHPATTVSVGGLPVLPALGGTIQSLGASRARQGYSEYTTPTTATQANRYLTLAASAGAEAPPGSDYGGSLHLAAPPVGYTPDNYPPVDDEGAPIPGPDILPGDYDGNARPLVIYDTLSAGDGTTYLPRARPADQTQPTAGATVTSPTARTLAIPAGLVFTLSAPQTAGDIRDAVDGIVGGDWPDPDGDGNYPTIPHLGFQGALHLTTTTGDYAAGQKMRFKLIHTAHDQRAFHTTTFTTTSRWQLRRRNLDTGEVTVEEYQALLTWPYEHVVSDGSGATSTQYLYTMEDEDWTEIDAPGGNESVELVLLPGENADPHSFNAGIEAMLERLPLP